MTGSMLIPNYLGNKTLLRIDDSGSNSEPSENSLPDAKKALRLEKSNRSINSGNIAFLTNWIRLFELKESVQKDIETEGA